MPSHFSSIGFEVRSNEEMVELAQRVEPLATRIPAAGGAYLRWSGDSGEELWLTLSGKNEVVGMAPHFSGSSSVRVRLANRIARSDDTELDGGFSGMADPDAEGGGAYPFVFDCPDFGTWSRLRLPVVESVQVTAFAHEARFYASTDEFDAAQASDETKYAVQSFFPIGLFNENETSESAREALAMFTGHVLDGGTRKNSLTGASFYWALVDTFGGRFDVVIDSRSMPGPPVPGGVLSVTGWLSGRLLSRPGNGKRSLFGLFGHR